MSVMQHNAVSVQGSAGSGSASQVASAALQCEVAWRVRAGSLAAEQSGAQQSASLKQLAQAIATELRGVHADHDVELCWKVRGSQATCVLRKLGQSGTELFAAHEVVLMETRDDVQGVSMRHIRVHKAGEVLLVATLQQRGEHWQAIYAATPLLGVCGLAGGRYEFVRP
jgi:hypothetical protein